MTDIAIRPAADSGDILWAAELISRSFDHLDLDRYVVPDDARRPGVMRDFYHLLSSAAADGAGEVLLTDGAVAVWFDRTHALAEPAGHETRLAEITGPYLPRFAELDALFHKHQPAERHWELAFLAVDASQRGRGVGSTDAAHPRPARPARHRRVPARDQPRQPADLPTPRLHRDGSRRGPAPRGGGRLLSHVAATRRMIIGGNGSAPDPAVLARRRAESLPGRST
jgi:hypothetical protein